MVRTLVLALEKHGKRVVTRFLNYLGNSNFAPQLPPSKPPLLFVELDLKAMNEFLNNTKESKPSPPLTEFKRESPLERYLTPLSDEATQASYQLWINQEKAKKKQRQLKLHDKMSRQKDFLPPGLTFEQFWAGMKHHSRNRRVLEYLYNEQNHMDHIKHECHITDKRNRIKQKQYMVQWVDTYIHKRHMQMYLEQGYKAAGVNTCPVLRQVC